VLLVEDEKTRDRKVIFLRETWFDTPCTKDSYIHLVGDFNTAGHCIVDNSNNMVILHPDHLISATVVADSVECQRRAVLQDRVKVIAALERPQAFGVFFHEIFQEALKLNQWDMDSMKALVETVMGRHVEDLYSIQMSIPEAVEYLMSKMPGVLAWADTFLHLKPQVCLTEVSIV
jgi:DNA replication ATP-dependent helicase Dna2